MMATFMGQEYLVEQVESFFAQTYHNWVLWASDDKSQDETCAILEKYLAKFGQDKVRLLSGPGRGFVANFLCMTCNPLLNSARYTFSD